MTKFILHGGNTRNNIKDNDLFFLEMVKNIDNHINFLVVYFAQEEEKWGAMFEEFKTRIKILCPKKNITFVLANKEQKVLISQIKKADVIYFTGGGHPLNQFFKDIDLESLLDDKVIAGSSAGAYLFSTYYYSNDRDLIDNGSGILPIKLMCHYREQKKNVLNKLNEHKELLDIHTLADEKMIILYN